MHLTTSAELRVFKEDVNRQFGRVDQQMACTSKKLDEVIHTFHAGSQAILHVLTQPRSSAVGAEAPHPCSHGGGHQTALLSTSPASGNSFVASPQPVPSNRVRAPSDENSQLHYTGIIPGPGQARKRPRPLPAECEAKIPPLPKGSAGEKWKAALAQWYEPNPTTGLIPLKDWPRAWYAKGMRTVTGMTYLGRKKIAEEWEHPE